jgi:hypothetical protein
MDFPWQDLLRSSSVQRGHFGTALLVDDQRATAGPSAIDAGFAQGVL